MIDEPTYDYAEATESDEPKEFHLTCKEKLWLLNHLHDYLRNNEEIQRGENWEIIKSIIWRITNQ